MITIRCNLLVCVFWFSWKQYFPYFLQLVVGSYQSPLCNLDYICSEIWHGCPCAGKYIPWARLCSFHNSIPWSCFHQVRRDRANIHHPCFGLSTFVIRGKMWHLSIGIKDFQLENYDVSYSLRTCSLFDKHRKWHEFVFFPRCKNFQPNFLWNTHFHLRTKAYSYVHWVTSPTSNDLPVLGSTPFFNMASWPVTHSVLSTYQIVMT